MAFLGNPVSSSYSVLSQLCKRSSSLHSLGFPRALEGRRTWGLGKGGGTWRLLQLHFIHTFVQTNLTYRKEGPLGFSLWFVTTQSFNIDKRTIPKTRKWNRWMHETNVKNNWKIIKKMGLFSPFRLRRLGCPDNYMELSSFQYTPVRNQLKSLD
jgi:hypothetical protein